MVNKSEYNSGIKTKSVVFSNFIYFNIVFIYTLGLYASSTDKPILHSPPIDKIEKNLIDMHAHIACQAPQNDCYINEKFRKHWKYKVYLKAFGVTKKDLEEKGDQVIAQELSMQINQSKFVKKAIVLALDGYYNNDGTLNKDKTQLLVSNKFVLQQTKTFHNLLYAASIHPFRKDAIEELIKAKQDGAQFIKWIPCVMNIDPDSEDSRLTQFYKKMIELDLMLLSHTGDEHTFLFSDNKLCDPNKLTKPLDLGVKVIASHLATLGKSNKETNLNRIKTLLNKYPDLKFDISSLDNLNKWNHSRHALQYSGRFYYGTDYPLIRASLLGIPLNSSNYYIFKLSSEWIKFINSLDNVFDKDVALKLALGVSMNDLKKSQIFDINN